jgi:PhoPQ-activated pathogenicity-related protein
VSPLGSCEGAECVEKYIKLPDASYSWYNTGYTINGVDEATSATWIGYILNMTSQTWITEANPDFPVWWHSLVVIVPSNLEFADFAAVCLEFGDNTPDGVNPHITNRKAYGVDGLVIDATSLPLHLSELQGAVSKAAHLATHLRSIAVSLFNGLNEVLKFEEDLLHMPRKGDTIKAWTWKNFLEHGATEPERIMELAVAKSVVRGMDTITNFTSSLPSGKVTRFGVLGYSKFGSATWMVATVDTRIEIIAPEAIVYAEGMYKDGWPNALLQQPIINPYDFLSDWKGTPESSTLFMIVNPLNYMTRLELPKFFVMDTNDLWFDEALLDLDLWWPALPGPKNMLVTEGEHDTVVLNSLPSVTSYFRGWLLGATAPNIEYLYNDTSRVIFVKQTSTGHAPARVTLHSSYTCKYVESKGGTGSYPSFLDSAWLIEKDLNETDPLPYPGATHAWLTTLSMKDVSLEFAIAMGTCAKGAFVMLEYSGWPEVGADPFNISTPVFLWH